MTTTEELKAIKAVLLERGWYQGDYANPVTGEVCIVGAMNIVEDGDPHCPDDGDYDGPPGSAKAIIDKLVVRDWARDIGEWNDQRGRTPEQVLALLDRAIAMAEANERRENPVAEFAEILSVEAGRREGCV